jgi:hypothetical protein
MKTQQNGEQFTKTEKGKEKIGIYVDTFIIPASQPT